MALAKTFHAFHPESSQRVALVAIRRTADREQWLVEVACGSSRATLRQISRSGPFTEEEVEQRYNAEVAKLREDGYWPAGIPALLEALDSNVSAVRARAALRLGWRKCVEAAPKILAKLPHAVDETCSYLDALGMIGDPSAIPALREYAQRKLLSRRRSAIEALRQIGDEAGLEQCRLHARERLPEKLRTILDNEAGASAFDVSTKLVEGFADLSLQEQGLSLDTLYEIGTPTTVAAALALVLSVDYVQPFLWRAAKSIFKRAMLRKDPVVFGLLIHDFDLRSAGPKPKPVMLKSGYDGQMRETTLFGRKTQFFLRAMAWRFLRDLARYRPEQYALHAAEIVIHYTPEQIKEWAPARYYVFHRILYGASKRFDFQSRTLTFRLRSRKHAKASDGVREESYPELWDAQPRAYLRLLEAARLPEVHEFALKAIKERHHRLLREAADGQILAMLDAPYEPTANLALAELDRRFDIEKPNWPLLRRMLVTEQSTARATAQRWLRLTAHLWLKDVDRILDFIGIDQQNLRALVVELALKVVDEDAQLRKALADRILLILRSPEPARDAHAGYAELAHAALLAELLPLVSPGELFGWLMNGSHAVQILAGDLLRRRSDAVEALGLNELTMLANHDVAVVRMTAHALLRANIPRWQRDPSVLFALVESDWEDTRSIAVELLRNRLDTSRFGFDEIMGLLDSNRIDVQDLGKELATRQLPHLPAADLVGRLAEHPHPNMRRFLVELAVQHLPHSRASLEQLKPFCRAVLLDDWPRRNVKREVIEFLTKRGIEDLEQAEIAAAILGDIVRSRTQRDSERALESLVRLKLVHPQLETTVKLVAGEVA